MATIQKRPQKNGALRHRVMIRQSDGFPPVSKTFPTKQEAKDWSKQEEARRRQGYGPSDQIKDKHTLADLIDRYTTGMRRGEIVGLTWDCIDLERQIINLKETKNGRPRTVSIVRQSLDLFRSHYSKRNLNTPFVFPAKKRFGKISIRKAWDEAVKRAGLKTCVYMI